VLVAEETSRAETDVGVLNARRDLVSINEGVTIFHIFVTLNNSKQEKKDNLIINCGEGS